MLNIAYGILCGSFLAVLYVPIFFIAYKQYFYEFDKPKIKHIANKVVATVVYSEYMQSGRYGSSYYINYCDYYYNGRRYTYKCTTSEIMDINSTINLYFISNPRKVKQKRDVGGKEYIPLLKLYIISWIFSIIVCSILFLTKINLQNNFIKIGLITVIAQIIIWILYNIIYNIVNFINKIIYGDKIVEVEATLVNSGKEGTISDYTYEFKYNNKTYKYKIKSNGEEAEKIKLYFMGNPKKANEDKEIIDTVYCSRWGKIYVISWLMLSLILLSIFIR